MDILEKEIGGRNVKFTEVKIIWNKKEDTVQIKKLTFGEINELNASVTRTSIVAGQPKMDMDIRGMSENCLVKSIIKAPFSINLQEIRALDRELGEELVSVFNELNTTTPKKNETSSLPSETEVTTKA